MNTYRTKANARSARNLDVVRDGGAWWRTTRRREHADVVGSVQSAPATHKMSTWSQLGGVTVACWLLQSAVAEAQTPTIAASTGADGSKTGHALVHDAASAGRLALAIAVIGLLIIPLAWSLLVLSWGWVRKVIGQPMATPQPFRWGFWSVVGHDGRLSTSKTVAIVWTYAVVAGLLSIMIAKWLGYPKAFDTQITNGLQAEYALLLGGPVGAAILAKGIVNSQLAEGSASKPAADSTGPSDLVTDDKGDPDLGDLQYVLFNLLALIFFFGEFLSVPANGLPMIPDVLLGLTSVSAVGYVSKKTLAGAPAITAVTPTAAHVGETVRLLCNGIMQRGDDQSLVTVGFGTITTTPQHVSFTTTQGALLDVVVPDDAAGKPTLVVTTPSGKKATWPGAFSILPTIRAEGSVLEAAPGGSVRLVTSGVASLTPLSIVTVKIAGQVAPTPTLEPADTLVVVIPTQTPPGSHPLELTTPGGTASITITVRPPAPAG